MANINIQLPILDAEHKIEIEVKVNGKGKKYHYRVEILDWEECQKIDNKAVCLQDMLNKYDHNWQLVQIGEVTDKNVSVMFRERSQIYSSDN